MRRLGYGRNRREKRRVPVEHPMTAKANTIRTPSAALPASGKSAVTNGKRLFVDRPGDTAWHRRFRDVFDQILADLGGPEGLSEGQRQLARRAATIAITCERMEGKAAAGSDINLTDYGMLTDRLGRTLSRLGLRRQARDVTPTLDQYLAQRRYSEAAE
jgi:hypothetical protein